MAVARHWVDKARRDAPVFGQLEVLSIAPPASSPGEAVLRCRMVRVFHGEALLPNGATLDFYVPTFQEGDRIAPGGNHWTPWDRLAAARYLEGYLCEKLVSDKVVGWGAPYGTQRIIDAPRDEPYEPAPTEGASASPDRGRSWLRRVLDRFGIG
jgi:hypothetical protein